MHEPDNRDSDAPGDATPSRSAASGQEPEDAAKQTDLQGIDVDSIEWATSPTEETSGPRTVPEEPLPEAVQPDLRSVYVPAPSPAPVPQYPGVPAPPHEGHVGRRRPNITAWGLAAIGAVVVVVLVAVLVTSLRRDDRADATFGRQTDGPAGVGEPREGTTLIVGPTGMVGSWTGSEWQPRSEGDQPGAGADFTMVGLDGSLTSATGEATAESCAEPGATSPQDITVPLAPSDEASPPPIAVAGVDDPRPRPVESLDVESETYRQAAAEVARGQGAGTPATVTQILRTDLDGGGTDEVVVAAEHQTDPAGSAAAGDWSIVFLRRLVNDEVVTDVLAASVVETPGDPLERVQVSAVADLNGDGSLELALSGQTPSHEWTAIHALGDSGEAGVAEVLKVTCES